MENFLGRQLWSIYEDLKREKKIGFLTDDEFQKYFLGFISYKYLSEKLESYINDELKGESLDFEEAYKHDDYKKSLRKKSIDDIGYFLKPKLLYKNIVSPINYGSIIIEELEKAFNEISDSSTGTESEEDFQNLFEGVDLKASQLGKTLKDKNKVVFNILDSLAPVNFDLNRQNLTNVLINKSVLENMRFNNYINSKLSSKDRIKSSIAYKDSENLINANSKALLDADSVDNSLNDDADLKSVLDYDLEEAFYQKYVDDIVGNGFEYLLNEFSLNSSSSTDYYTPKDVSKLIAKLISSQKRHLNSVYDPCCGTASLLLEVHKELPCDFICGQELNTSIYNIARENMILHNIHYKDFDIKQGDTLEQPQHLNYTFDAIVSEIPFNSKWTADKIFLEDPRFREYNILSPKTKASYAFIQHMIYHLNDDGIMIVIAPHGLLFRSAAEGTIRKYIVGVLNCLDAVIGLPANMFYSTNIPTCLMIFKKNRNLDDDVLFIDASNEFDKSKLINNLRDDDIQSIVSTYKFRDEIDKYSHRASLKEIEENDFNLNIPRYVDTFIGKRLPRKEDLIREHLETMNEIEKVTELIKESFKELNIENDLFK